MWDVCYDDGLCHGLSSVVVSYGVDFTRLCEVSLSLFLAVHSIESTLFLPDQLLILSLASSLNGCWAEWF
jgi:hypothetical protein